MNFILETIDSLLFGLLFVEVFYLLLFALFSLRKAQADYPPARKQHRFIILFPAYREDNVIEQAIDSFLSQTYPKELYDLVVISDQMQLETNEKLSKRPLTLLQTSAPLGSKAAALNYAIDQIEKKYDCVVILDADNLVDINFLEKINDVYDFGIYAIQAHRKAKNKNTDVAILDAASEEINNSLFRKGHVNVGFPSALSGSGMAFDFEWFRREIKKITSVGEDKELELLLMKQKIYIEYLDDVLVLDEKVESQSSFYNQRARWIYSQFNVLLKGLKDLPNMLFTGNGWYLDKLFQWIMFPRVILFGLIFLIAFISVWFSWTYSLKWWGLLILLFLIFSIAMPDELMNKDFKRAIRKVPILFLFMFLNLFRIRKSGKNFIHTQHKKQIYEKF